MQTVTISGTDFNAYASVSQADSYLLADVTYATWDANDNDTKGRYLVSATRLLDAQSWRSGYDAQIERESVTDIINASILIANAVSNGNTEILGNTATEPQQKRLKAGSVEIENFRDFNSASFTGSKSTDFPPAILALLKPYLAGGAAFSPFGAFGLGGDTVADDEFGVLKP